MLTAATNPKYMTLLTGYQLTPQGHCLAYAYPAYIAKVAYLQTVPACQPRLKHPTVDGKSQMADANTAERRQLIKEIDEEADMAWVKMDGGRVEKTGK